MASLLAGIAETERILAGLGEVELNSVRKSAPLSLASVEKIAESSRVTFPPALLKVYLREAGDLSFSWVAEKAVFGEGCSRGNVRLFSPVEAVAHLQDQKAQAQEAEAEGWVEEDEGYRALAEDWPHWVPFFRFPSGDCFCFDLRDGDENPPVVLLEHDVMDAGPDVHGLRIAPNVEELLVRWSKVLFVELFDWTHGVDQDGINPNAAVFRKIRGAFESHG